MYDLISGLSLYLEREHGFTNKLVSGAFRSVRNTLDNVMKERTAEGVGGRPERDPILEEHEQVLWEKGILGEDSPDKLRQTVFLGGLSLHLNHLIASHVANYDWPFGTLPFGLFGSNLDTRDLETYPRTYSGHF